MSPYSLRVLGAAWMATMILGYGVAIAALGL